MENSSISINQAITRFIQSINLSRSENTAKTYFNGLKIYVEFLESKELSAENSISIIKEEQVGQFCRYLKSYSPSTENLYINVFKNFLEYLAAENLLMLNLQQIKYLIHQRTRKPGIRLPQFPQQAIEKVLDYALMLLDKPADDETERLINLRDSAFLLTLADTGLRIHEICGLRRGDVDWFSRKAQIIGKGNKQAIVRFSERSITAIKKYISLRAEIDGAGTVQLSGLPVFARHDKGAGKRTLPITTKTGRMIVENRVREALGTDAVGTITPHSFRHYFVTTVLQETGNLKIAQEFARHTNIAVTQRYTHLANEELDEAYKNIFDK